ncbi:MAG: hypothetical protein HOJ16_07965 [Candidatus Peribacter sp.]|jgi:hypothetical protein|nr:hypothetical protein [Candidatus Peribacter sp.]
MNIKSLVAKCWKSEKPELEAGDHLIDEVLTIRVQGVVKQCERETDVPPTVSIPLITTLALFWEKSGVTRDAAMRMLRESITEAMDKGIKEDEDIAERINDVERALRAVREDLIERLPRVERAGKLLTKGLSVEVVQEPVAGEMNIPVMVRS